MDSWLALDKLVNTLMVHVHVQNSTDTINSGGLDDTEYSDRRAFALFVSHTYDFNRKWRLDRADFQNFKLYGIGAKGEKKETIEVTFVRPTELGGTRRFDIRVSNQGNSDVIRTTISYEDAIQFLDSFFSDTQ